MSVNSRSVVLTDDEASRFFGGTLARDPGLLAKLWDGASWTVDRSQFESAQVKSPRVTTNLMVQPSAFEKFMARKGEDARGVGLLARWLVAYPVGNIGFRPIRQIGESPAMNRFNQRVTELLEAQLNNNAFHDADREVVLRFSADAQVEWMAIANQIEAEIRPGGRLSMVPDYASKAADNIARLAGIIHAFEGYPGIEIDVETLRAANEIVYWHSNEFIRLFSPLSERERLVQEAQRLELWFLQKYQLLGILEHQKGHLLKGTINSLRDRDRLDPALIMLQQAGRLSLHKDKQRQWVVLNEAYFKPLSQGFWPNGFLVLA